MAAAPGLDDVTSAYRLYLRSDGSVDRVFATIAGVAREARVRRFLGGMSFLESLDGQSVQLPHDRREFHAWASDLPRLRCRIPSPQLHSSAGWLATDFRIGRHLDTLLREAHSFGHACCYQVHFLPFLLSRECERAIAQNLLRLNMAKGVPKEVLTDQQRLVDRLATATTLVEEIVATDNEDAAEWLQSSLTRLFRDNPTRKRIARPEFTFVAGEDELKLMMHSSLLYGDPMGNDLICSHAEGEEFRSSVLGYRPPGEIALPDRRHDRGSAVPDPPIGPSTPVSEGPGHIFISYRRLDWPRVGPIVSWLAERRLPIWYDRGIDAGEEWDTVLERKIVESGMVLLFLESGLRCIAILSARNKVGGRDQQAAAGCGARTAGTAVRHSISSTAAADQRFGSRVSRIARPSHSPAALAVRRNGDRMTYGVSSGGHDAVRSFRNPRLPETRRMGRIRLPRSDLNGMMQWHFKEGDDPGADGAMIMSIHERC